MTFKELKEKNKKLLLLGAQIEVARSVAEISPTGFSMAPAHGSGNCKESKDELVTLENEYEELKKFLKEQKRILNQTYVGSCIVLHIFGHLSWKKVAQRVGGGNSKDTIRMMCHKYEW